MVTLYGAGAITITRDKETYRSNNGVITLPDDLARGLEATGKWARTKPADPADEKTGIAKTGDLQKLAGDDETTGA